jgi:hypothetical protein
VSNAKQPTTLLTRWQIMLNASRDPDTTKSDIAVFGAILERINSKTGAAYPALATIAEDAGVNRSTAVRSINRLVEFDYLRKKSGDRVRANTYKIGKGRCGAAPRCGDATHVGAATPPMVGAATPPQSFDLNPLNRTLLKEHTHYDADGGFLKDQKSEKTKSVLQEKKNLTIEEWLKTLKGKYIFEAPHPVLDYTKKVGLNSDMLALAWRAFRDRYEGTENRQPDWGKWFLRALKGNWGRIWLVRDGSFYLTTTGQQYCLEMEEETGRTLDVEPA